MTYKEEEKPDVFIHLRINSRITTCLLDTGSPISLGNSSNFKKVNDSNAILKSVGGKRIIAKGEIDVEIENNAGEIINQKLIIVDNLGIDVVLGRDYINRIEQGKILINIIQKMDIKNNVEENIFMVNVNAEIKKDEEEVENAIKNMNMENINKEEEYEVKQLEEKLNNKLNKNDDIQHKFKNGDLVLVKNFNRSEHDHSTKFIQKWKGPFRVKNDKHKVTVGLETLDGKNYDNVHSRYIIRYKKLENEIDNTNVNEIMKFRNKYNERNIGLEPEEMDNAQDEDYIENETMETNHEGEEINSTSKINASETSDTNEIKDKSDNDIEHESINDKTNEFNETNGMKMRKHKNQRKKLRRNQMNETKKLCKSSKKDNRKKQLKTNSQNNSTKPNRRKLIKNLEEPELKRSTRRTKPVTRYNSILFEHLDYDDTLSKPID